MGKKDEYFQVYATQHVVRVVQHVSPSTVRVRSFRPSSSRQLDHDPSFPRVCGLLVAAFTYFSKDWLDTQPE